ncbi:hypothetical protein F5B19DRAFT_351940 [Rostrohypoxylon terebratum]|nr:hypothetical protein F5B19DRAFT_351940 [Rostrohypoxylon terebratum]
MNPPEMMDKKPSGQDISMKEMWDAAAKAFEEICGESLQRGDIRGFQDVQMKIEAINKASFAPAEDADKWDKAKSIGLKSLKFLKMLVGAASQASSLIPIPSSAASIASSALCFVFDIPQAIKGYNDAINQVFGEVSSALSQFKIYTSMENIDPELIQRIHLVMISFVKLCGHVVKYRQGRKRDRLLRQIKSIFDEDSGLGAELAEFKRLLQQQRDVEGTVTLAVVVETRQDVAILLERSAIFGKTVDETHKMVQETQNDVQSFKDDVDRSRTLTKIRDALGIWPTVRLDTNTTQTCTNIYDRCHNLTGSWIWTNDTYTTWVAPNKDKETSHVLILSGPPSSGKTSATALITKRLEEQKGRKYVAHYFFPPSTKKSDDEKKSTVHLALKYMAFQIARVDLTVQKPLGKACDAEPGLFRRPSNLETLDALWGTFKIGTPGSGATYYLVFDGIENLSDKQADMLLNFAFGPRLADESAGRVRVLLSGTDDQFSPRAGGANTSSALRIRMEEHNAPDMRIVVDEALTKRGMLEHTKPGSEQRRARDKIIEKLPQNVSGSYSRLQFGLDDVVRLLSTRTAARELDHMLDQPISSHEAAIKTLQRSLTTDEIDELNELLKWVLFGQESMTLDQLEAAMFLYSGTESIASLEFIIKNKYSAVLKLENGYVYGQDGVQDYLQRDKDISNKSSRSRDHPTISMTITINNVDQELCGHFLWDLAHKAIRDKFRFDFDAASANGAVHSSNQAAIRVDEFEAHHTIITRAFEYLDKERQEQTKEIGQYLVGWLPYHLGRLRQLEDEEKGDLTPAEQIEIGQNLYKLFKDENVVLRHRASFEQTSWYASEMEDLQKWLMDSAVVRRLDKKWRDEIQLPVSPTQSFLKEVVKVLVRGFLRERNWDADNAYTWIQQLMQLDKKFQKTPETPDTNEEEPYPEINWDDVSTWCQSFLGLPNIELDSLWYERLAESAFLQGTKPSIVLSLYERAIEKGSPSWICYRGLGKQHFSENQTEKAITHVELALKEAEQYGATPKPETKDIVELHLLLGQYTYEAGESQRAAGHYLIACKSEDSEQAIQGQLGYLKAGLSSSDTEAARHLLESMLARENGEGTMTNIFKVIARDAEHDMLVSRIFTVARDHTELFQRIVRSMEVATTTPALDEDHSVEITEDKLFAEDEARGVLLYHRGVAAYTYKVSPDGTEAIEEALRLWRKSRELLSNIGGSNALITRQNATTALATHYFQDMMDGNHLDHAGALARLAEADSDNYLSNAAGFLGTVYSFQGKKEQARATLSGQMKQALRILLDDIPENDLYGFSYILDASQHCQDLEDAVVAMSFLCPSDLVAEKLIFENEDIERDDGAERERLLERVSRVAKEIIQATKAHVPEASQQILRIEAAKAHVESLMTAAGINPKPEADDNDQGRTKNIKREGELTTSDLDQAFALNLIHSRLVALQHVHSPKLDKTALQSPWTCDGRTPDGKLCDNTSGFENEFYHCMYCSNQDFCGGCLARLRTSDSSTRILACSAKHRWLRVPPHGDDMFVGLKTKNVRIPKEVRATKDDERIVEICYGDDEDKSITMEEWKEALAKKWGISLEDLKNEISRQATPDGDEQDEGENGEQAGEKSEPVPE